MKRSLILGVICLLTFAACGDAGRDGPHESVLHRGTGEEPESLDVHKSSTTEAGHVQRDLGEGLVGYTPDGELSPAAAERWEVSADGTEYLFSLQKGARWSNGDRVTAEDFVYSFRRLVDPETAAVYTQTVTGIANAIAIIGGSMSPDSLGVEAVGEHELRITLSRPIPYFLGLLTHPSTFPVHRGSVEEHGDAHARPGNLVTNGAYRLVDWQLGSHIEIARNEHYRDNENTAIDRVFHYVTPEPMAELNRYRAGELHITRTIPPEAFVQMKDERPAEVKVSPALGVYYYGFNLTKPPFENNLKLREALSMAVDRETIVDIVGRGEAPAYSWVPDGVANYEPSRYSWAETPLAERLRTAKQLYREAGYAVDTPDIEIRYNTHETHQQVALAIQSMWKDAFGFEASLVNEEFQVLVANARQREVTRIFRLNWNGDYNDPQTFLTTLESDNPSNFTGYASEGYDSLMERAAAQVDPERRKIVLQEAERQMLSDYPLIPIYFYVNKSMVSPRVEGWGDNVLNYHYSQHLGLAADE